MHKFLGLIFSPIHYVVFGALLAIFHPVQWLCLKLGGYAAHKRSVDILNMLLTASYYLVGCRVTFNGRELPKGQPLIFVANHQSMYDIPPLIWFLRDYHAKFISKIELTRGIPSISFNLKYGGAANIDRKDPKQSISEILKLAKRMNEHKWSAVIFPEGTRSRNGLIKPFAPGGMSTLLKKVPTALVVPIVIDGSWKLTRYGSFPLSFGEKIKFTVLNPIATTGRDPQEIVSEAEHIIRETLHPKVITPTGSNV